MPTSKGDATKDLKKMAGSPTDEAFNNSLDALRASDPWKRVGAYSGRIWLTCEKVRLRNKCGKYY